MSGPKPYHHGDLRDALLTAGEGALADLPLAEVSLREIARRAGVSHAAPKHHFGTLGELLGEFAARGFDQFVQTLATAADQASEQTPADRMHAMMRAYLRFADAQPAVYGLMGINVRRQAAFEAQAGKAMNRRPDEGRPRDGAL